MPKRVPLESVSLPKRRLSYLGRSKMFGLMLAVCMALVSVQLCKPRLRLIWNASASVPIGLYWLEDGHEFKRDDLVLVWLPAAARQLAAQRAYLPADTPAVKRIAALAGDTVCAKNGVVRVNGRVAATTRPADQVGRPLASWQGCDLLASGQVFLLAEGSSMSFDGRYFGPSERRDIVGRLVLLWTL